MEGAAGGAFPDFNGQKIANAAARSAGVRAQRTILYIAGYLNAQRSSWSAGSDIAANPGALTRT